MKRLPKPRFRWMIFCHSIRAEIYKIIDKNGRVSFTDQNPNSAAAEIVEIEIKKTPKDNQH